MIENVLKYFLGGVFLLSALAKLIDYSSTVDLFIGLLNLGNTVTKIFLAILILLELIFSYLIIADYLQIKKVYFLILGVVTAFLLVNIFFAINGAVNCGCFGAGIISAPLLSIIKNILMIMSLVYLRKKHFTLEKNYLALDK